MDEVSHSGQQIRVRGWFVPIDDPHIHCDGVTIYVHGQGSVRHSSLLTSLDSPDVANAFPSLSGAQKARFEGTIIVSPANRRGESLWNRILHRKSRNVLLEFIPRFIRSGILQNGQSFFFLLNPDIPRPNSSLITSVGGGFENVMRENLGHFVTRGDLHPTDDVLDVGCGIGRMAYILAYYLLPTSCYEGFDVDKTMIAWARDNISNHFVNFNFQHADIFNVHYNPQGKQSAIDFMFPYSDVAFDFVFLTSVFTHLKPDDTRHYLSEISRVLRPGGRCVATAFFIDDEVLALIRSGKSSQPLLHSYNGSWIAHPEDPEAAIGHPIDSFISWAESVGLRVRSLHRGIWPGRIESMDHQDMIVFEKIDTIANLP